MSRMKVSVLLKYLEDFKSRYGDREVVLTDGDDYIDDFWLDAFDDLCVIEPTPQKPAGERLYSDGPT